MELIWVPEKSRRKKSTEVFLEIRLVWHRCSRRGKRKTGEIFVLGRGEEGNTKEKGRWSSK